MECVTEYKAFNILQQFTIYNFSNVFQILTEGSGASHCGVEHQCPPWTIQIKMQKTEIAWRKRSISTFLTEYLSVQAGLDWDVPLVNFVERQIFPTGRVAHDKCCWPTYPSSHPIWQRASPAQLVHEVLPYISSLHSYAWGGPLNISGC